MSDATKSIAASPKPRGAFEGDAVRILDELVLRAVNAGASDIHLEPKRERMQVRFRVDGSMAEQNSIDTDTSLQVVSRIKVLSRIDISERRMPQDGQFTLDFPDRPRIHMRVATFPCSQGEKLVLRILRGQAQIEFPELGMGPMTQKRVRELVGRHKGFIVKAGPTGSGKTSN